ncbi:putative membrane protein [Paraburkholderia sp. GAS199]|uniref:hypothetical protein n=1 Tax=Paraburkholderia sp. GAS199 TaxID=3035126 RepID=UPI003D25491B
MKSLIQSAVIALALAAPIASFAQSSDQPQNPQATQQSAADSSGYGPSGHGSWQAGNSSDTTVSSYSPPIHNVR